jgi:hypothetical protein
MLLDNKYSNWYYSIALMSAGKSEYWIKKKAAGEVYPTRECLYCKVKGRGPNMSRYHFDNCKQKA